MKSRIALHIAASKFAVSASVLGKLCFEDADIYTPTKSPSFVSDNFLFKKIAEYDRENKKVTEGMDLMKTKSHERSP